MGDAKSAESGLMVGLLADVLSGVRLLVEGQVRIEAKQDAILEALAAEDEPETVDITTLSGDRVRVPAGREGQPL